MSLVYHRCNPSCSLVPRPRGRPWPGNEATLVVTYTVWWYAWIQCSGILKTLVFSQPPSRDAQRMVVALFDACQ